MPRANTRVTDKIEMIQLVIKLYSDLSETREVLKEKIPHSNENITKISEKKYSQRSRIWKAVKLLEMTV